METGGNSSTQDYVDTMTLSQFVINQYTSTGIANMLITEFWRGIAWTIGAVIILKVFKVRLGK
jgi:hypothetical protein